LNLIVRISASNLLPELVARPFLAVRRTQAAVVARDPLNLIYSLEPTVTIESLHRLTRALPAGRKSSADLQVRPPPWQNQQPIVSGSPGIPLAEIAGGRGDTGIGALGVGGEKPGRFV